MIGIVDRLYSERRVLVRHIVFGEGVWAVRTGRVVMFAREQAQVNEVDLWISCAQLMIKQRQKEVHPVQSQ